MSLVASGTDADHGAARSAMSEKAMTSSSIDVALTVTEFGRKCRSNSGMCSSSHARLGSAPVERLRSDDRIPPVD